MAKKKMGIMGHALDLYCTTQNDLLVAIASEEAFFTDFSSRSLQSLPVLKPQLSV